MKQKMKTLLLTIITGLLLYGCQDDLDDHDTEPKQSITLKNYSLKEANKIPKFKIANAKAQNELRKTRKSSKFSSARATGDFIAIDSSTVSEISFDDFKSYTMLIEKEEDSQNYFENLVIHVKDEVVTEVFVVKYTPTQPPVFDESSKSYTIVANIETNKAYGITTLYTGNGTDIDPDPSGSGGVLNCIWVMMCNGRNGGGLGLEHRSTQDCQHSYLKRVCDLNMPVRSSCNAASNYNTGNGHGGSGTGSGSNNVTTSNPITTPVIPTEPTPCEKVVDLLESTKANIKQAIVDLRATITPISEGENGTVFGRNLDGNYQLPVVQAPSVSDSIRIRLSATSYSYAHTHPNTDYAMFSTGDLFSLLGVADNATVENKKQVSIILVAKDNAGMNLTYALTIDNIEAFRNKLHNLMQNIPRSATVNTRKEKLNFLEEQLGGKYYEDDNNLERAFLQYFEGFSISLLKANVELTEWTKLSLSESNNNQSSDAIVIPASCNQN